MKKALKITGLATLALTISVIVLIISVIVTITFTLIGVLFVIIATSGTIVLAIIGIITPKEKLKKIANAIDIEIEDEN